jgi:hypothetical protein
VPPSRPLVTRVASVAPSCCTTFSFSRRAGSLLDHLLRVAMSPYRLALPSRPLIVPALVVSTLSPYCLGVPPSLASAALSYRAALYSSRCSCHPIMLRPTLVLSSHRLVVACACLSCPWASWGGGWMRMVDGESSVALTQRPTNSYVNLQGDFLHRVEIFYIWHVKNLRFW